MNRKFIWWLGCILFVMFSVVGYTEEWPTYHSSSSDGFHRSGVSPLSVDPSTLTLNWLYTPSSVDGLEPAFPNGTGAPIVNGGQSAVIAFGKVYYGYYDTLGQDVLVCLDAFDGSFNWKTVLTFPTLGAGFIQVPTVAERTVDAVTDTVVYIYGTNNSVRCINANTGVPIWTRTGINASAANMRSGAPAVFDTLLICHDNGGAGASRRIVTALRVRNGLTAWSSVQMSFRMFLGPTLTNDTVIVAGRGSGISGDGGGQIVALNANTGAVLTTYDDPLAKNYQNTPVVFGDNIVAVTRNDAAGTLNSSLQVWKHTHDLSTPPSQNNSTSFGITRFSTPEVYVDIVPGETLALWGASGPPTGDVAPGDLVLRRILPATGSLRSYQTLVGQIHGPGAIAGGNAVVLQGDDAGYWWCLDGNTYGVQFAGLGPYWLKQFPSHITAGAAIATPTLPDTHSVQVVIIDGNGNCASWVNGHVTSRPRAQVFFDYSTYFALSELTVAITPTDPVTGNGGFTQVTKDVFMNSGNEPLTYSLDWGSSPMVLQSSDFGWISAVTLSRTNPTRQKMAKAFVEDNVMTAGHAFLEKKYAGAYKGSLIDMTDLVEEDGVRSFKEISDLLQKSTYFGTSKLQEAKAKMSKVGWLFINDNNAGVAAPGAAINLDIVAVNPDVGFGEFFGEIKLFNTNEPDVQGNPLDTTIMPVRLIIGYLGQRCDVESYNAGLTKTNYGRDIAQEAAVGFYFDGAAAGFDGGIELGNNDSTFAGLWGNFAAADPPVPSSVTGFKADSDCVTTTEDFIEGLPLVAEDTVSINYHQTKYAHVGDLLPGHALPLLVRQYGVGILDTTLSLYAGDAIYQTLVVSCTGSVGVTGIELGAWADLDVDNFAVNKGGIMANNDAVWQYDNNPDNAIGKQMLFGILRVPGDNIDTTGTATLWTSSHASTAPPGIEWLPHDPVEIQAAFDAGNKGIFGVEPNDLSSYNGSAKFDLAAGESKTITYVWFGADTTGEVAAALPPFGTAQWGSPLHKRFRDWLRNAGYYRGDVKGNDAIYLDDVMALLFWINTADFAKAASIYRPKPFVMQGDVDGDGDIDIDDRDSLYNYVFKGGTAPVDYDRFVPAPYKNSRPGLTNDVNWKP